MLIRVGNFIVKETEHVCKGIQQQAYLTKKVSSPPGMRGRRNQVPRGAVPIGWSVVDPTAMSDAFHNGQCNVFNANQSERSQQMRYQNPSEVFQHGCYEFTYVILSSLI